MKNRFQILGTIVHQQGSGREQLPSLRIGISFIQVFRRRFQNFTSLHNDFQNATSLRNSTQTVRNRLHGFVWGKTTSWPCSIDSNWEHVYKRRETKCHGYWITGIHFSLMNQTFTSTVRIDDLGCGGHAMQLKTSFLPMCRACVYTHVYISPWLYWVWL